MVQRLKKLVIWDVPLAGSVTAWTAAVVDSASVILEDVIGWDTTPAIRRNTAPKLFGDGQWQSTAAKISERQISITMFAYYPDNQDIRGLRQNFEIIERTKKNDLIPISMTYYSGSTVVFKEVLQVRPMDAFIEEWEEMENGVHVTVNFTAPDPYKTVYLNGSSTPQAEKRL